MHKCVKQLAPVSQFHRESIRAKVLKSAGPHPTNLLLGCPKEHRWDDRAEQCYNDKNKPGGTKGIEIISYNHTAPCPSGYKWVAQKKRHPLGGLGMAARGDKFTIWGRYRNQPIERIDGADSMKEARYLLGEYRLAYGMRAGQSGFRDWKLWIGKKSDEPLVNFGGDMAKRKRTSPLGYYIAPASFTPGYAAPAGAVLTGLGNRMWQRMKK